MKANYMMDLAEARRALEAYLKEIQPAVEVGDIIITSFDLHKIVFHEGGLVEAEQFRHRIKT